MLVKFCPFIWRHLFPLEVSQIVGVGRVLRLAVVDVVSISHKELLFEGFGIDERVEARHLEVLNIFEGVKLARCSPEKIFSCFLSSVHTHLIFKLPLDQIEAWWL